MILTVMLALLTAAPLDSTSRSALEQFKLHDDQIKPHAYLKPNTDNKLLAWAESYVLMSFVSAYEGTQDIAYLDRVFEHAAIIMANRDDRQNRKDEIRGKIMPAWSTGAYTKGKRYAWNVHAGMITYPIARACYLVRRDKLGIETDDMVKLLTESVDCFDPDWRDGPVDNEGYYHAPSLKGVLPYNQQNATGRTMVMLWMITGEQKHRDRAAKLAYYFKNRLRTIGEGETARYDWSYRGTSGSEDLSHAAINADFAFVSYRAGIVFDPQDMHRFARTLHHCRQKEGFAGAVNGRGGGQQGQQAGRWGHLAMVDRSLRRILLEQLLRTKAYGSATQMLSAAYLIETQRPVKFERPLP